MYSHIWHIYMYENWDFFISKMPKNAPKVNIDVSSYINDEWPLVINFINILITFPLPENLSRGFRFFFCKCFSEWKAETAIFFFFLCHFQDRVWTLSEMYEQVSFGCMFMIGFARFVKFYGILVALAKKHTKVKLPVWETASQWFAVGKGEHLPEFIFLPFLTNYFGISSFKLHLPL